MENVISKIAQQRLNAFKERQKRTENSLNGPSLIWKPSEGINLVRMIPYAHDKEFPIQELKFHYGIGKYRSILSPKTYGEPDPFEEFAEKLRMENRRDEARKFMSKSRFYVPLLVRGQENEGVKFWGFGSEVYRQLLEILADPEYSSLFEWRNGRDIKISFKKGETPADYMTSVLPSSKETPVLPGITPDIANKLLAEQKVLVGEVFKKYTYEELSDIMKEWINGGLKESDSDLEFAGAPFNGETEKPEDKFKDLW